MILKEKGECYLKLLDNVAEQVYHVKKSKHMCKVGGVVEPGDPAKSLDFSSKAKRPGSG